jgi:glycosyltransferase involved in cell wall biosynthesis
VTPTSRGTGDEIAVSVIVPAMNARQTLPRTLEALAAQNLDAGYEVIVVDDGSDDDTAEIAARAPGPVSVITKARGGPGSARNRGVEVAQADLFAFTDADCFPAADWLREGLAAIERTDLVQGAVCPDPLARRRPFDRSLWVTFDAGLYQTANLFVRRSVFERVGGFEDWLRPDSASHFGEDVVFAWRARRTGAKAAFCERALVHHAVFPRGPRGYLAERRRLAYFPALVRRAPELRRSFLYRGLFLSSRSAAFDLAVVGGVLAVVLASPLPLLAMVPYAWLLGRSAIGWRRRAPIVAPVEVAGDVIGFVALAWGSLRSGRVVL